MEAAELRILAHALRQAASAQQAEMERLLEQLVMTESHASQPEGVSAVAHTVVARLEAAGFRDNPVARPDTSQLPLWLRELMLPGFDYEKIADVRRLTLPGAGDPVLILADLDTAFLPGITREFAFTTQGDRASGPGIADMKGGLVVLVAAFSMLDRLGSPHPPVTLILSPDEQAGSLASGPVIAAEAAKTAACICLECAREGGNLMGSRASCGVAVAKIIGREAHAGTDYASGLSAIRGFASVVEALEGLSDSAMRRFVTVTQLRAGWRRSVVPGECDFTLDIRALDSRAWHLLDGRIHDVLAGLERHDYRIEINSAEHRPGITRTVASEPLIQTVVSAGRALDLEFGVIGSNAGGSSAFAHTIPVIDGMGPPGGQLMTRQEHISRSGLLERACLLALTVILLVTERR